MKNHKTILFLLSLIFAACNNPKQDLHIETGVAKTMAEYRTKNITDLEYQLTFEIPEKRDENIPGKNTISFNLFEVAQDLQIDFREDANLVLQVICNGKKSNYRFEKEHIIIPKGELVKGSNQIEIEFTTGNTSLNRNDDFLYTLFVPDRARTAFPCFDQPDLKASFQLNLTVPSHWKAMANGKLIRKPTKVIEANIILSKQNRCQPICFPS